MTVFVSPNDAPARASVAGRAHTVPTYTPGSANAEPSYVTGTVTGNVSSVNRGLNGVSQSVAVTGGAFSVITLATIACAVDPV